ncbi:hypothetical protein AVEN_205248-1 [Araneus ventricosus]|uniref:Uncharacterized protein n=1 Tax=Araneus ventricosus TaxID=182803 RepID=A0A4Y1ZSH1_ARAVE|nr:hypothetical protein AVEN_205248-1 [Araneus ventricosus]
MAKRPPVGVAWKLRDGATVQVSSSSSDGGSKLRGPSQNSPRVASERDVNITKLNFVRKALSIRDVNTTKRNFVRKALSIRDVNITELNFVRKALSVRDVNITKVNFVRKALSISKNIRWKTK